MPRASGAGRRTRPSKPGERARRPGPLGGRHERPDARQKVAGATRYVADLALPGMLHAAVAVSPLPSARLLGLELGAARAVDGVEAVLTAADVPGTNQVGRASCRERVSSVV